jgi:hypothetical protein
VLRKAEIRADFSSLSQSEKAESWNWRWKIELLSMSLNFSLDVAKWKPQPGYLKSFGYRLKNGYSKLGGLLLYRYRSSGIIVISKKQTPLRKEARGCNEVTPDFTKASTSRLTDNHLPSIA